MKERYEGVDGLNNGLSEASKEQLKHKTGEEIVDADIAQQMETK